MNSVLQHGEFEQQIKEPIIFGKYRKWTYHYYKNKTEYEMEENINLVSHCDYL